MLSLVLWMFLSFLLLFNLRIPLTVVTTVTGHHRYRETVLCFAHNRTDINDAYFGGMTSSRGFERHPAGR